MAQRRMFSLKIVDTDAFIEMPLSAQALYFHLGMRADDDGFIANAKRVQRAVGAADDDLKILFAKRFILAFESGVVVVKHWKVNNYIQKDRRTPTLYQDEFNSLYMKENGIYTDHPGDGILALDTKCIQDVSNLDTQYRLGKVSIDKNNNLDNYSNNKVINNNISPEPKIDSGPKVAILPLNTGEEYPIYQKDFDEWQILYPAVDVLQELNKMRGWCIANPDKRKTKRGVKRFINSWLSRQQDRGGTPGFKFDPSSLSGLSWKKEKKVSYRTIVNEDGEEITVEEVADDGDWL